MTLRIGECCVAANVSSWPDSDLLNCSPARSLLEGKQPFGLYLCALSPTELRLLQIPRCRKAPRLYNDCCQCNGGSGNNGWHPWRRSLSGISP